MFTRLQTYVRKVFDNFPNFQVISKSQNISLTVVAEQLIRQALLAVPKEATSLQRFFRNPKITKITRARRFPADIRGSLIETRVQRSRRKHRKNV